MIEICISCMLYCTSKAYLGLCETSKMEIYICVKIVGGFSCYLFLQKIVPSQIFGRVLNRSPYNKLQTTLHLMQRIEAITLRKIPKFHLISYPANISMSFQRCFQVDMMSRYRTTSNQRRNNVVHVNVEIYNVGQCQNNVSIFSVDFHNVRQR